MRDLKPRQAPVCLNAQHDGVAERDVPSEGPRPSSGGVPAASRIVHMYIRASETADSLCLQLPDSIDTPFAAPGPSSAVVPPPPPPPSLSFFRPY